MYEIDFHADDYAASPGNSARIIQLMQAGLADSCSVITNMGCYGECMEMLRENWARFPRKPKLTVHLNLIDGFWLSAPEEGRKIRNSWAGIFFRSFLPSARGRMREAFSREMEAQIRAFLRESASLRDDRGQPMALRLDSHVHTHMIPLVFQALTDALRRMELLEEVRFIRCSTEPLAMFLLTPGVAGTVSPVNLVKNLMLHALSHAVREKLGAMHIPTGRIFGVAMTGRMDLQRVSRLMPKMKRYARRKDAYLEVLSHPGRVPDSEMRPEYGPDDRKAFLSPRRDTEYQMLTDLPASLRQVE